MSCKSTQSKRQMEERVSSPSTALLDSVFKGSRPTLTPTGQYYKLHPVPRAQSPMVKHAMTRSAMTRSLPSLPAGLTDHVEAVISPMTKRGMPTGFYDPASVWTKDINRRMHALTKERRHREEERQSKQEEIRQAMNNKKSDKVGIAKPETEIDREKLFGTFQQKEQEREARLEEIRKAQMLRNVPVDKCFSVEALRARRARELLDKELEEFKSLLPTKEMIKAQEQAAFRHGLLVLRAQKARHAGNQATSLADEEDNPDGKAQPKPQKPNRDSLVIRLATHNLLRVPAVSTGLLLNQKLKKNGIAVVGSQTEESKTKIDAREAVAKFMFSTAVPNVSVELYQRSSFQNLSNHWFRLVSTGVMKSCDADFNELFRVAMEGPRFLRIRVHDMGRANKGDKGDSETGTLDTVLNVLGSADIEIGCLLDIVEQEVEDRKHELLKLTAEAAERGQTLACYAGDAHPNKLSEPWVQVMFALDYPESSLLHEIMEEVKCRVSLHCKLIKADDVSDAEEEWIQVPSLNENISRTSEYNPEAAEPTTTSDQLYFHRIPETDMETYSFAHKGQAHMRKMHDLYQHNK